MAPWSERAALRALVVALALATVATAGFAASTSDAAYSTYNDDWNGSSALESVAADAGAESVVARSAAAYSETPADRTVAFVLAPDSGTSPAKSARMAAFVRRGGTVVVAGDYGSGANEILRELGASARLDGRSVLDERSNYRSKFMPVATPVADRSPVAGVDSVTLNHGTVVRPNGATVLLNTSEYAYIDENGNGTLDASETLGPRPVATVERLGDGRIVTVSDPSVFINAMLDRPGNRRFVRALLAGKTRVLLDHTERDRIPMLWTGLLLVRESAALQLGVGLAAVSVVAVWSRSGSVGSAVSRRVGSSRVERADRDPESAPDREDLLAGLERRYPDWDRERLERVVEAVMRRRE